MPRGTNRGGRQSAAFKKLSKNPLKLRFVREFELRPITSRSIRQMGAYHVAEHTSDRADHVFEHTSDWGAYHVAENTLDGGNALSSCTFCLSFVVQSGHYLRFLDFGEAYPST